MLLNVVSWMLLAAIALAIVLLFNYWASLQPLSTLAYSGIVLALAGLANLIFLSGFWESANESSERLFSQVALP